MIWRIGLTLFLVFASLYIIAIFGGETALGILLVSLILLASIFVASGELIIGRLPTVRRINSLRDSWGEYNLDPGKLATLRTQWEAEKARDAGASLDPTRIRNFCALQLEKLIEIVGITLANHERSRKISDVIRVVSYPESRLAHITYELRLYALLLALTFIYQLFKKAPDISAKLLSANFLEGCKLLGERPIDFVAGVELAIFAVFATRLLGEMSNLRQYTK